MTRLVTSMSYPELLAVRAATRARGAIGRTPFETPTGVAGPSTHERLFNGRGPYFRMHLDVCFLLPPDLRLGPAARREALRHDTDDVYVARTPHGTYVGYAAPDTRGDGGTILWIYSRDELRDLLTRFDDAHSWCIPPLRDWPPHEILFWQQFCLQGLDARKALRTALITRTP